MRRNRIKAVINVPRGGRPSQADRPLTPISSNLTHEPSSPITQQQSPLINMRPQSPLLSPKSQMEYPTLGLVRSPGTPEKSCSALTKQLVPLSPSSSVGSPSKADRFERPTTPSSKHLDSHYSFVSVNSPNFPISPGGIQRPSPSASPASLRYIVPDGVLPSNSPARPSPSPSPNNLERNNRSLMVFNNNSNSADSHEVARYMAPSPGGMFAPRTSDDHLHHRSTPLTPTQFGQGAFSSVMRDHANSILNNSESLRQRLQKQPASLTVSKYHTLRKEFLAKGQQQPPSTERQQLTMLHFAVWNPPKKDKERPASRNRTSSVCSDRGPSRQGEVNATAKSNEKDADVKSVINRRVTVGDMPMTSPLPARLQDDNDSVMSDAESTVSSAQQSVGPRVKVGPDGQLIIDEQSLVVETSESQRAKKQLSEMETISGADFVVGSSGLFRNKRKCKRGQDWSDRETIKFYKALSMCGTDFSMMTTLFAERTRPELKAKFKREDRKNPAQISLALSCQQFDPDEGITDDDDEEETSQDGQDLVIGGSGKSKKKKKGKRPLTELERRLEEELEESRAVFQTETNTNLSQPQFKNLSLQKSTESPKTPKHIRAGVRGQAGSLWKTTAIIDDETGQPVPPHKLRKQSVDLEIKPKKPRKPRTRKVELKGDLKGGNKDVPAPAANPPANVEDSNSRSLDCIEILRYDDSDPLGLKLVPVKKSSADTKLESPLVPPSVSDLVTLTPVTVTSESPKPQPCSRRTRSTSSLSSNCSESNDEHGEGGVVKSLNKKSTLPANVKVLPFRVPGPGPFEPQNKLVVDEIEIEISCQ